MKARRSTCKCAEPLRRSAPLPGRCQRSKPSLLSLRDWYDLLSRLQLALNDDPAILVIDEFPGEESSPGLDGLLQSLWDLMLRGDRS